MRAQKFPLPPPTPAPITTLMLSEWETDPARDGAQRPPTFSARLPASLGATLPLMKLGKTSTFLGYHGGSHGSLSMQIRSRLHVMRECHRHQAEIITDNDEALENGIAIPGRRRTVVHGSRGP